MLFHCCVLFLLGLLRFRFKWILHFFIELLVNNLFTSHQSVGQYILGWYINFVYFPHYLSKFNICFDINRKVRNTLQKNGFIQTKREYKLPIKVAKSKLYDDMLLKSNITKTSWAILNQSSKKKEAVYRTTLSTNGFNYFSTNVIKNIVLGIALHKARWLRVIASICELFSFLETYIWEWSLQRYWFTQKFHQYGPL